MLKIYTSQYNYNGKNRLDITVKSGHKAFRPTWKIVMDYKNGLISADEYTEIYNNMMRKSYITYRSTWDELLAKDEVVLVCFCPKNSFCHRLLLAEMLEKLGGKYKGEI